MCLIWHTRIHLARGLLGAHWLRVRRNSEVKRVGGWSNPRMGDRPGSCSVSSQKQILAGWNSEIKLVGGWSNPRMGDRPGKLLRELPETNPCGLVRM
ncbi:hypothetical protein L3X38_026687 [Prunus dulcis]|uniref:Uncharacterized protein n=1 Tax=Prunus dulcis TaxID=3755 RepID=A0AAD4YZJ7_PRUDU|nr:hypothetical protein L3X38_026687 [Prunus dulcis]